jgi:hypothetical protein
MVTFSNLGKYGRLGNQLFQISAVYSHAKNNGYLYGFPEWEYNKYLDKCLEICNDTNLRIHRESDPFGYSEIPSVDHLDLIGYFQNENYFREYKNDIKSLLKPKSEIIERCSVNKKTTAIHIRRGDYLKFPDHHPVCSMDYYNRSIEKLKSITDKFLIFSDDIEWCKNNFIGDFEFSLESDEFIDLIKMSMCDNFIIANSSFSWWGSYLGNDDSIVIAPDNWVGPGYFNKKWRGIYRENMIIM